MRHWLHKNNGDEMTSADLDALTEWLGLPQATGLLDRWNQVAAVTGLPQLTGRDTITEGHWNHAVDVALRRHA